LSQASLQSPEQSVQVQGPLVSQQAPFRAVFSVLQDFPSLQQLSLLKISAAYNTPAVAATSSVPIKMIFS